MIDVAVTSPLADTCVRMEEPCDWYAATQKHGKYDASFKDTQYTFSAMVFETLGAVMLRARKFFVSYFALQPSDLVVSSLLITAEPGREFRAICNGLFRKLF